MTDLSMVMASVLTSLIKARYIADLKTAGIAELYYDLDPLKRLSVPRARVPVLEIDLPILVENVGETTANKMHGQEAEPDMNVEVRTANLKEPQSLKAAARLHMAVREEGLELETLELDSGGVVMRLSPE